MLAAMPTILVDTREKSPWSFTGKRALVVSGKLDSGDYSIRGMVGAIAIERKSVEDLFLTMTRGLARFERELERSMDEGRRFFGVIVEGSPERLALGSRYSYADPGRVVDLFYKTCVRRGASPYLCDGRAEAEAMAWRILHGFWAGRPTRIHL